jgi:hypothetical protein
VEKKKKIVYDVNLKAIFDSMDKKNIDRNKREKDYERTNKQE